MGNYNSTIRGSNIIITSTTTENNNLYNNNNNNGFISSSSQFLKNDINNNKNEILLNNLKLSSKKSVNLFKNASLNATKLISDHLLIGNGDTLLDDDFIDDISSSSSSSLSSLTSSNNITQSIIIGATNDHERYNDATIINSVGSISGSGLLQKLNEKFGRGLSTNEVNMIRNQITLGGTSGGYQQNHEDLLKQMEYDKFMNEIWIGIVLTLIVISLVFCICSCFLYHQFRQWKRNYRQNIQRNYDIESVKLNIEDDDPVPNYTLVSGLPSYEAALELLRNSSTSQSSSSTARLLPPSSTTIPITTPVPSIFQIFSSTSNEKDESTILNSCQKLNSSSSSSSISSTLTNKSQPQQQQQQQQYQPQQQQKEINFIPSYEEAIKNDSNSIVQQNSTTEKIVSSNSNNCDDTIVDTKLLSNTI